MTRSPLRPQVSLEVMEGETTRLQGEVEEVEELLDVPRPDMELLENDCNKQPFTFCDLLSWDGMVIIPGVNL